MSAPKDKYLVIPCKSYIRKYIETRHGAPFRVTNSSTLGIYIYALLDKKLYDNRNNTFDGSFIHQHFNDRLPLVVSSFVFYRIGFDISPEHALAINRLIEEQFEEHLFLWCDAYVGMGKERKDAIWDFAEKHGIDLEIDIGYEALKKSEYRLRKKKEATCDAPGVPRSTYESLRWERSRSADNHPAASPVPLLTQLRLF